MQSDEIFGAILEAVESYGADGNCLLTFSNVQCEEARIIHDRLCDPSNNLESRRFKFSFDSLSKTITVVLPEGIKAEPCGWLVSVFFITWARLVPAANFDVFQLLSETHKDFGYPYIGTIKEADSAIWLDESHWPFIVMEVGWSESLSRLRLNRDIWLQGSGGAVRVVIIVKFTRGETGVRGSLEISCQRDGEITRQTKSIWPITEEEDPYILLGDLYGSSLPEGYDGNIKLPLCLSLLRSRCKGRLKNIGLIPAE
ncbi:hypothetical protein TWF481_011504 [Arthrobotrys musiformis]|uniref:Uncharacterized protein n=1 Tax=Arthrobotrys musiformis TaxID=47236 RepID=A0AAV9W0M5_9PEZI